MVLLYMMLLVVHRIGNCNVGTRDGAAAIGIITDVQLDWTGSKGCRVVWLLLLLSHLLSCHCWVVREGTIGISIHIQCNGRWRGRRGGPIDILGSRYHKLGLCQFFCLLLLTSFLFAIELLKGNPVFEPLPLFHLNVRTAFLFSGVPPLFAEYAGDLSILHVGVLVLDGLPSFLGEEEE